MIKELWNFFVSKLELHIHTCMSAGLMNKLLKRRNLLFFFRRKKKGGM